MPSLLGGCLVTVAALTALCSAQHVPTLEIMPKTKVLTKALGQSFALTCTPNVQNPDLITQLEWRDKNGFRIDSKNSNNPLYVERPKLTSNSIVLYFNKLSPEFGGVYNCMAKYSNTEDMKASIQIETIIDITFKNAASHQFAVLGENKKVNCEVEAKPPPEIAWIRNGVTIYSDDKYIIDNKGLLITNVTESDDGEYVCRAVVIRTGNLKERTIRLEVQTAPKIDPIIVPAIIEGESTSIQCKGTGKPPPTFRWIKDDTREDLSRKDRFDVKETTGHLIINKAEFTDSGTYKCIARNNASSVEAAVRINVLVKPRIFEYINVTAPVKTHTKIICKAFGRPAPLVTFRKLNFKDAYVLGPQSEEPRIIIEQNRNDAKGETIGILNVDKLNRTDDGLYECIAKNDVGTAYKNGHITVEFPPTFEKVRNYPPVWTWADKPGNLSCIAESIPNATITWKLNGLDIIESPTTKIEGRGPRSNLIVYPFNDKRYFSRYECIARNRLGEDRHFIELRLAAIPEPIQQVKRMDLTATTVRFNIFGPGILHGLPLRAYIVQYQPERELSWDRAMNRTWSVDAPYIVENLVPQETYRFRFSSKNDVGVGYFNNEQVVTMPRRSVPAEPKILVSNLLENNNTRDFVANSPYADHFELRWNVPNDNGDPITGYLIRYCVSHRVNGEWRDSETQCSTQITQTFQYTSYELTELSADTTYKIELRAKNAIGASLPAQIRVKTARGVDTMIYNHEGPSISSAMIIGIVVGAVIVILILVDITCFCVNRAGILALMCARSKPVDDEDAKLGRDEKEPLSPEHQDHSQINGQKRNISVEFDGKQVYSKPVTEIGRHSAV